MFKEQPIKGTIVLESGTLWTKVIQQTEHAIECGALLSIPTTCELIEQGGVRFLVRILSNLVRKDEAKQKQDQVTAAGKEFNPFLPYDQDLFVADISATHVCLLNKFNVADYHLLIITRSFEEQETWLNLPDFEAMWACLDEFEGLAFYNAGKTAGASQRHKHLQIVPLPLTSQGSQFPIEPLLVSAKFHQGVGIVPSLPFVHAITQFDLELANSPLIAAQVTLERYHTLLDAVGLHNGNDNHQSGAYNLLATRKWLMIVPRSQESFESIPVNSLGFAGTLLVRNEQQLQILKAHRPLTVLSQVGVATNSPQ